MEEKKPQKTPTSLIISSLKLIIAFAIIAAAIWQIKVTWQQIDPKQIKISYIYLFLSAVLYWLSMMCFGVFWARVTRDMGGKMSAIEGSRMFLASQVGKYIPGKAMVIVMRCGMVNKNRISVPLAAISSFFEALTMMGVGALVGAIFIAIAKLKDAGLLLLISMGMAVMFMVIVQPSIFMRILKVVSKPFNKNGDDLAKPVQYRTIVTSIHWQVIGWVLMGISMAICSAGIGKSLWNMQGLLLCVGGNAFATVAGFTVIFVPGGAGVRELAITKTLGYAIGPLGAVVAIMFRLVQIIADIIALVVLYPIQLRSIKDA